jgi:hypothetical protein
MSVSTVALFCYFEAVDVKGRIIIKWILNKYNRDMDGIEVAQDREK